jgi:hypothetical protein
VYLRERAVGSILSCLPGTPGSTGLSKRGIRGIIKIELAYKKRFTTNFAVRTVKLDGKFA